MFKLGDLDLNGSPWICLAYWSTWMPGGLEAVGIYEANIGTRLVFNTYDEEVQIV
jgi:hypothetical protein